MSPLTPIPSLSTTKIGRFSTGTPPNGWSSFPDRVLTQSWSGKTGEISAPVVVVPDVPDPTYKPILKHHSLVKEQCSFILNEYQISTVITLSNYYCIIKITHFWPHFNCDFIKRLLLLYHEKWENRKYL